MKILFKFLLIVFSSILLFGKCGKDNTPTNTLLPQQTLLNVSYGTNTLQNMDIYLPAGRTNKTKTLILVHGGSWSAGDKADFNSFIPLLQQAYPEVAIANINYRLATATADKHPSQINDITSAINFLKNNKATYTINDTFGLIGASAGAHLSLLYLCNNPAQKNVKVLADIFGPTDFLDLVWLNSFGVGPTLENFLGVSYAMNQTLYQQASPLRQLPNIGFPPTIIFHGTNDIVVPVRQSDSLDIALQAKGVPKQYVKYIGENHGFSNANNIDMINKITQFFRTHL
jgi:acetyl esterase/lipase